ncbi:Uncharacterized protein dnm_069440 [Desulfonema magnum]|uniref:Uncharacterized protein n=1 Tax=Desulfonema magnum TaxID=45655 RepID=A0A975GRF6_9BACT|nr:Uncharacterized protein dnm_069440 [Desulfonema magnum]
MRIIYLLSLFLLGARSRHLKKWSLLASFRKIHLISDQFSQSLRC